MAYGRPGGAGCTAAASISAAGWRLTPNGVNQLAIYIKEEIKRSKPDYVVFQLLDNDMYLARGIGGTMQQPKRDHEGAIIKWRRTYYWLASTCR